MGIIFKKKLNWGGGGGGVTRLCPILSLSVNGDNVVCLHNRKHYIAHKHVIRTAVSDVNEVAVSTLLNRNIDVNYQ